MGWGVGGEVVGSCRASSLQGLGGRGGGLKAEGTKFKLHSYVDCLSRTVTAFGGCQDFGGYDAWTLVVTQPAVRTCWIPAVLPSQ